jgi:hypothetical protein
MSYLDVPRLHFSGLFFTGPSTINNIIKNYDPTIPLEKGGQFLQNALWNPLGVAQWWLEECTVLSAVGSTGAAVASTDAVIGAAVLSPSPKTPMSDGTGGFYDLAKMVDLDPDQQGRSALYGVRIAVTLPNGAGLQGLMTVPELRQLNGRIAGVGTSYGAVGQWMGTLQNVLWSGDISSSPFLVSLKAAATGGLNVKLTVDLHQNNPQNLFTSGDQFCYGRVLGSIGPVLNGELAQVLPGRCLQTTAPVSLGPASLEADSEPLSARERVGAKMDALGKSRAAANTAEAPTATPDPWNPAFALIRQVGNQLLLSIDIGGCMLLHAQGSPLVSDGTFEVDSGIVVGVVNTATNKFTPFTNGNITISPQYQQLQSTPKNCVLVKNSCVFTFPITTADGASYQSNPLAIQVNGTTVAQEYPSGYWMDVSVNSQRLECGIGNTAQSQIMVRKFGVAVVGQAPPVTFTVQLSDNSNTNDVNIGFGQTDTHGLATITTKVYVDQITLPTRRQPLDSQVCFIAMDDPNGNPIGDGVAEGAQLSVLLFDAYQAPANPTWSDVGAIFGAYARLYPGMKSRLDISDQATVVGDVGSVLEHMSLPISDPAYMPVTRDLSPSKMAMIISWLKSQVKS